MMIGAFRCCLFYAFSGAPRFIGRHAGASLELRVKFLNARAKALRRNGSGVPATPRLGASPSFERYKRNALISAAILIAAFCLVRLPDDFDRPLERAINYFAGSEFIDTLFFDLDTYFTFTGALLFSLIWLCWFGDSDWERRARGLAGICAALVAGIISRLLQHALPTHPRPFYDATFGFHPPSMLSQTSPSTWNSFPSDHAAVFFGLVAVIWLFRPRLGLCAFIWLAFAETSRAYIGAHYPSDLIGGAALGFCLVWSAQAGSVVRVGRRVAAWERASPAVFYGCAFFFSYQMATLFAEVRSVADSVGLLRKLYDLLLG